MATADKVLNSLRRNHTPWSQPRRQQLQVQKTQVTLPAQITSSTDPAVAPLGTEVAAYTSEFDTDPGWAWNNQGTSTVRFALSRAFITPPADGANTLRMYGPSSFPAAPWTVRTWYMGGPSVTNTGGGFAVWRASAGKFHTPNVYRRTSSGTDWPNTEVWAVNDWSSPTTLNVTRFAATNHDIGANNRFLQIRCDGTSIYFDFSPDNSYFINVTSTTLATYLGGTGTDLRVYLLANNPTATAGQPVIYQYFRTYADANLNR